MQVDNTLKFDVVIVGAGIVGATLALLLAKQTDLSIALLEAVPEENILVDKTQYHPRVSAVNLASMRIFEELEVWETIKAERISPYTNMQVWDEVYRAHISFAALDVGTANLGFIIENNVMQTVLRAKVKDTPNITFLAPIALQQFHSHQDGVSLTTDQGQLIHAKIAIAADGARSWLRNAANIGVLRKDYDQTAIVGTVNTALPHDQTARQVFLATGPLAFLPLLDAKHCSIVWTLPSGLAQDYLAMDTAKFNELLASHFQHRLGAIEIEKRYAFPLYRQEACHYVQPGIALVGDAAHTVHPLAGLGLNIGLLDAGSLAEIITNALQAQRRFYTYAVLRKYERWRKSDNMGLMRGIDAIKQLFSHDKASVRRLVAWGLNQTDKSTIIKNFFIRHALGNRDGLPNIAAEKLPL